jgi:hypothetical protein
MLEAAVRGDIPAGCRTHISGGLAENDGLLSLPLSSKGGEGNGAAASEHRDACKEPDSNSTYRSIAGIAELHASPWQSQSFPTMSTKAILLTILRET